MIMAPSRLCPLVAKRHRARRGVNHASLGGCRVERRGLRRFGSSPAMTARWATFSPIMRSIPSIGQGDGAGAVRTRIAEAFSRVSRRSALSIAHGCVTIRPVENRQNRMRETAPVAERGASRVDAGLGPAYPDCRVGGAGWYWL